MLLQLILFDLCSHKEKLVLHFINDIFMDFLRRMKFYATRIVYLKVQNVYQLVKEHSFTKSKDIERLS